VGVAVAAGAQAVAASAKLQTTVARRRARACLRRLVRIRWTCLSFRPSYIHVASVYGLVDGLSDGNFIGVRPGQNVAYAWTMGSRIAAFVIAGGTAVVAVVGCSPSSQDTAPSKPQAADYDISRLEGLKDAFPSGLIPEVSALRTVDARNAKGYGRVIGSNLTTVDPPACRAALEPVQAPGAIEWIGLDSRKPDGQQVFLGAIHSPAPFDVRTTDASCDLTSYTTEREKGTIERVTAPVIDGVTTRAFRIQFKSDEWSGTRYYYAAVLNSDVLVDIRGVLEPPSQTPPSFSDLLVRSVAAIRGS
jgi:hypothetical protein